MAKTLQLNFSTAGGKKMMLTVDEPREDVTEEEVGAAMQEIIDAGAFAVEGHALNAIVGARIVERTVTELSVE